MRTRPFWCAIAAYALLGLAWLATTPPWGAPDEAAALVKGVAAAHGQLIGKRPDYTTPASSFIERWYRDITTRVSIPARNQPPELIPCYAFDPRQDASCLSRGPLPPFGLPASELETLDPTVKGGVDIRVLVARLAVEGSGQDARLSPVTYVGTYPPSAYVVPGIAAALGSSPDRSLYLGRLVSLATTIVLVAIGLLLLPAGDGVADGYRLAGAALALTPMALFSASVLSSSGPEITAAFCHVCVLVALSRAGPVRRLAWVGLVVSVVVLALARSLGPGWIFLLDAGFVVAVGRRRTAEVVRAGKGWIAGAVSAFAVATIATVGWQVLVQPQPASNRIHLASFVAQSFHDLPTLYQQQIGVLGWLDTRLPLAAYWVWSALLIALVLLSFVCGSARARLVVAGIAVATVVATVAVDTVVALPVEAGAQGRWTLPVAVALPIVAGEICARARRSRRLVRGWVVVVVLAAVAVVQFAALWAAARRYAVGVDGPWAFIGRSRWHPPLGWWPWALVATVAAVLLVTAGVSAARGVTADPTRTGRRIVGSTRAARR